MPFDLKSLNPEPEKSLHEIFDEIKNATEKRKNQEEILRSNSFQEEIKRTIKEILTNLSFQELGPLDKDIFQRGDIRIEVKMRILENRNAELEIKIVTKVLNREAEFSGKVIMNEADQRVIKTANDDEYPITLEDMETSIESFMKQGFYTIEDDLK